MAGTCLLPWTKSAGEVATMYHAEPAIFAFVRDEWVHRQCDLVEVGRRLSQEIEQAVAQLG